MSSIAEKMRGRWESVLPNYVDSKYLTGKHMDCPICREGKDRFRFDNKEGKGTYFCAQCGAGDGFSLVMGVTGMSFSELAKDLSPEDHDVLEVKKPVNSSFLLDGIAKRCELLTEGDSVSRYLRSRGITQLPSGIRLAKNLRHYHDGKTSYFDAMVARITSVSGHRLGFHVTWLKDGGKAPVSPNRKIYKQAETISGGGVYLGEAGDAAVIGEGIETTLAGMKLTGVTGIAGINATLMQAINLPEQFPSHDPRGYSHIHRSTLKNESISKRVSCLLACVVGIVICHHRDSLKLLWQINGLHKRCVKPCYT